MKENSAKIQLSPSCQYFSIVPRLFCWKSLVAIVCCFLFLSISTLVFAATSLQDGNYILSVADIHFDPFIGCSNQKPCPLTTQLRQAPIENWEKIFDQYSDDQSIHYYQDTSYWLLKSSLKELQLVNQQKQAKFVLMLGDFFPHHFKQKFKKFAQSKSDAEYREFAKKVMQFLTYEMKKTFPEIDVYSVIGNNDSYDGNYSVNPGGVFLKDTMQIWSTLIKDRQNQKSFQETFSSAGYYVIALPDNNKIIFLNTVLFSTKARAKAEKKAAVLQLQWLHNQLLLAQQQHQYVLLAFHIPMGIDVFATLKHLLEVTDFWQASYTRQFEAELKEFSQTITTILPSHIHRDTWQLVAMQAYADIPVVITPSISPIYGNDPAFKVLKFNEKSLQLKNIETYTYEINDNEPSWQKS